MVHAGRVVFASLAAGFFGAQSPGVVQAQNPFAHADSTQQDAATAPIRIERFRVTASAGKTSRTWVVLWFRNEAKATADEILFVVRYDGSETVITDKGTFSPGALIAHAFIVSRAPSPRAKPESAVRYIEYADGSHWGER